MEGENPSDGTLKYSCFNGHKFVRGQGSILAK